jgi:hypothetical protein
MPEINRLMKRTGSLPINVNSRIRRIKFDTFGIDLFEFGEVICIIIPI